MSPKAVLHQYMASRDQEIQPLLFGVSTQFDEVQKPSSDDKLSSDLQCNFEPISLALGEDRYPWGSRDIQDATSRLSVNPALNAFRPLCDSLQGDSPPWCPPWNTSDIHKETSVSFVGPDDEYWMSRHRTEVPPLYGRPRDSAYASLGRGSIQPMDNDFLEDCPSIMPHPWKTAPLIDSDPEDLHRHSSSARPKRSTAGLSAPGTRYKFENNSAVPLVDKANDGRTSTSVDLSAQRRKRILTTEGREHSRLVRMVGACVSCRRKKVKVS